MKTVEISKKETSVRHWVSLLSFIMVMSGSFLSFSQNANPSVEKALYMMDTEKKDKGLALLEETAKANPADAAVLYGLGYGQLKAGQKDLTWLRDAYYYAVKDYHFWTRGQHLAGKTGLSRFYDFGTGPVPELDTTAKYYYADMLHYFMFHPDVRKY